MGFWTTWALWEKLCFVLACGIVLTVMAGAVKLVHKHWQLRKYTAIAAKRKEEAQEQEMRRTASMKRGRGPDVPFGVRAIESGVEVDGVWISRTNTPAPSSRASPVSSPIIEPNLPISAPTSVMHISQMTMPQPVYPYSRAGGSQSSIESRPLDSQFERATSAERLPSRNGSPAPDSAPRGRRTYQPRQSSHLRYSNGEALSGHAHTSSRKTQVGSSKNSDESQSMHKSGSMSSEEEFPSHYIPRRYDPSAHARYTTFSQGNTEDWPLSQRNGEPLDHLTERREIHAAESGRLLPRHRAGGVSGEWTSKGSLSDDQSIPLDNLPYRNPSPLRDPFATPIGTSLQQSDSLDAPSFQSFLDSDPTHTRCHSILFPDDQEVTESQDIPQSFEDVGTSRHLKQPQVVRKVNSGFVSDQEH